MSKKRQHFLDSFWKAYPSVSSLGTQKSGGFGKIRELKQEANKTTFKLLRNFKEFEQTYSGLTYPGTDLSLLDVLIPGDAVYVDSEELCLLTPNQWAGEKVSSFTAETANSFQDFKQKIIDHFRGQGFSYIDTPSLVESGGVELFIENFETTIYRGSESKKVFLPSSPEFHLKKALCLGFDKVFEIAKAYRNNESGDRHQLEFWMLEWYRSYDNLESIINDCRQLVAKLFQQENWPIYTVRELFLRFVDFDLQATTSAKELKSLCQKLNMDFHETDDFDDLFFRIYLEKIEPNFKDWGFFGIRNYPASQAALARINEDMWADRFELYYGELELANAFHELNDPVEQEKRFIHAVEEKNRRGLKEITYDKELIDLMKLGLPPSGGIALGLERLFLVYFGAKSLSEIRLFPND